MSCLSFDFFFLIYLCNFDFDIFMLYTVYCTLKESFLWLETNLVCRIATVKVSVLQNDPVRIC